MRIVILAVDDDDVFRASGDDQFAIDENPDIAGSQPPVSGEQGLLRLRIMVDATRNVRPFDLDVPHYHRWQLLVIVVGDADQAIPNGTSYLDETDGLLVTRFRRLEPRTDAKAVPVDHYPRIF